MLTPRFVPWSKPGDESLFTHHPIAELTYEYEGHEEQKKGKRLSLPGAPNIHFEAR